MKRNRIISRITSAALVVAMCFSGANAFALDESDPAKVKEATSQIIAMAQAIGLGEDDAIIVRANQIGEEADKKANQPDTGSGDNEGNGGETNAPGGTVDASLIESDTKGVTVLSYEGQGGSGAKYSSKGSAIVIVDDKEVVIDAELVFNPGEEVDRDKYVDGGDALTKVEGNVNTAPASLTANEVTANEVNTSENGEDDAPIRPMEISDDMSFEDKIGEAKFQIWYYKPCGIKYGTEEIINIAKSIGISENDDLMVRAQALWNDADKQFCHDRDIVATVVYNEAWYGCTTRHRELVAAVVMNRVKHGSPFRDTVEGVVNQPRQYSTVYTDPTSYYSQRARANVDAWQTCQEIAAKAMAGKVVCPYDVVYQANFKQGHGTYEICHTDYSTTYFCYI